MPTGKKNSFFCEIMVENSGNYPTSLENYQVLLTHHQHF
jgi:hypothetical protein